MKEEQPLFHTPKIWLVGKQWVWPMKILLFCIAGFFAYEAFETYTSGIVYGRHNKYTVDQAPIFWMVMLFLYSVVVVGAIWQSFRVKPQT